MVRRTTRVDKCVDIKTVDFCTISMKEVRYMVWMWAVEVAPFCLLSHSPSAPSGVCQLAHRTCESGSCHAVITANILF